MRSRRPFGPCLASLLLALLLTACASAPLPAPLDPTLFADARFGPPAERPDPAAVFALSPEMRRFLDVELAPLLRQKGRQRGLLEALTRRGPLELVYEASHTRNASEAFAARSGNCLSLVLMTAALAHALDLPVTYQSAYTDETWSRSGGLFFRSGHVNLTLGSRLADAVPGLGTRPEMLVDFLPPEDLRGLHSTPIREATVLAMYMNNRAAEALAAGRLDEAYAFVREALRADPAFASAWNTLGVIYARHGDEALAERVYERLLAAEPRHAQALANSAQLMQRLGRGAEAAALRERLAQVERHPPYHFYDLGREAMERGDYRLARELFGRELDRAAYQSEFHYWYGLASFRLGDLAAAREHLGQAMENSATRSEHDLYAAKLDWLRSQPSRQ